MTVTESVATDALFVLCGCCRDHDDMPLAERPAQCQCCGEWCSCRGCQADGTETGTAV